MSTIAHVDRLAMSGRIEDRLRRGDLTAGQVDDFTHFLDEVDRDLLHHRVILDNAYTRWFRGGAATDAELGHFVQQFSVFSNQFLVAALLRVINAPSLAQARAAKEILMNELGVIYRKPGRDGGPAVPLDEEAIVATVKKTNRVLVVHEDTRTGGLAGEIAARINERCFEWLDAPVLRVTAHDVPLPYAPALEDFVLPQTADLVRAARHLAAY